MMMDKNLIHSYFELHKKTWETINYDQIIFACELIAKTAFSGKKVFIAGNGGSAYCASHFVTDWNKMITLGTGQKFRGISLADNYGIITAYANDISYNDIFSGQLASLADAGDLCILISGSGNSQNVVKAAEYCKLNGVTSLSIVGYDGGKLLSLSDHVVHFKVSDMQIAEDLHLMFGHMVMKALADYPKIAL